MVETLIGRQVPGSVGSGYPRHPAFCPFISPIHRQASVPNPSEEEFRRFVEAQVDRSFPVAVDLLKEMSLSIHYKDLTFETLNREGFLDLLAKHFLHRDWEKAYQDFVAVKGEDTASNRRPSL